MPGPHSNLPGYELFRPIYLEKGKGAHLYDVDGNDFIDYMAGLGAGILGDGNPEFLDAVKKQLDDMYFLDAARRHPLEIQLAKKIIEHVPCAKKHDTSYQVPSSSIGFKISPCVYRKKFVYSL